MHNRRFSPTPNQTHSNHSKGGSASVGENVDVNVVGGNFPKHHQFLFPSHLYKRLFDTTTAIFPKAPPTTSTMNVDNKNTTAPEASVIPKNLLFSCAADDVGKSDDEERNKENEEVRFSLFLFFSSFLELILILFMLRLNGMWLGWMLDGGKCTPMYCYQLELIVINFLF